MKKFNLFYPALAIWVALFCYAIYITYLVNTRGIAYPNVDTDPPKLISNEKIIKKYEQPLEFNSENKPVSWLKCDYAEKLDNGHFFLSGNVVYSKDKLTIHCKSCFFDPNTNKVYNAKNIKIY